ncbi:Protein required for alkaline pH response via the RIM101 signaling pathway [Candida albicans P57055]|nr:Protein required for alkaline pH response via the RIM101 signaling pathway [Candida albicans P57055]
MNSCGSLPRLESSVSRKVLGSTMSTSWCSDSSDPAVLEVGCWTLSPFLV